ncbi:MAG: crossover junction endodeoxyribonuclease RuvC [Candidatus Nanopelagicales bacterium]
MRVLGIDPGLTRCGVAVVSGDLGRPLHLDYVTVLTTPAAAELPARLVTISTSVAAVIEQFRPDVLAVERMFSQHNLHSVMGTAQAAGVAVLAAGAADIPVRWHTPTEVKAAVTGSGRADKAQVAAMVCRILRLPVAPRPVDATDALALAICQLWRGRANDRLAAAVAAAPAARIPTARPRVTR